jgi:hypothetical protein
VEQNYCEAERDAASEECERLSDEEIGMDRGEQGLAEDDEEVTIRMDKWG